MPSNSELPELQLIPEQLTWSCLFQCSGVSYSSGQCQVLKLIPSMSHFQVEAQFLSWLFPFSLLHYSTIFSLKRRRSRSRLENKDLRLIFLSKTAISITLAFI